ncbi:MAG: hypothetical protein ACYSYT_10160, partial [Planctomycetota bacterium]
MEDKEMDTRRNIPRLFRAAAVAFVGVAMVCGLLILFSRLALPAMAAPRAIDVGGAITGDTTWFAADTPHVVR